MDSPRARDFSRSQSVLVVDDDVSMRESVALILPLTLGVHVEAVGSAESALMLVRQKKIDLALVDLVLPDMSGLELARRFHHEHISVPWILMSGFMDYDTAHCAGKLGALRAIALPTDLAAVVAKGLDDVNRERAWPTLPVSYGVSDSETAAERWARLVLRACDSDRDPHTLLEWSRCVGLSYSSLTDASRIIQIDPHDARDFARILRALFHTGGRVAGIESLLHVFDSRTLTRLLHHAGLVEHGHDDVTFHEWLRLQKFVPIDHPALAALVKLMGA
jgi:CheY-like chemotaxis protein